MAHPTSPAAAPVLSRAVYLEAGAMRRLRRLAAALAAARPQNNNPSSWPWGQCQPAPRGLRVSEPCLVS